MIKRELAARTECERLRELLMRILLKSHTFEDCIAIAEEMEPDCPACDSSGHDGVDLCPMNCIYREQLTRANLEKMSCMCVPLGALMDDKNCPVHRK